MLNVQQLRQLVIKPTLEQLILSSDDAEELLVFTCAIESNGGSYLKQIEGPALGIYQMEPKDYYDIWVNYIKNKPSLLVIMNTNFNCVRIPDEQRLIYDLRFATAMARIHYLRISESIPSKTDTLALWNYYKTHYNTQKGAATQDESIRKYLAFISN